MPDKLSFDELPQVRQLLRLFKDIATHGTDRNTWSQHIKAAGLLKTLIKEVSRFNNKVEDAAKVLELVALYDGRL
eukprot:scaffold1333_cov326-Ochromonas_danica.AAC.2